METVAKVHGQGTREECQREELKVVKKTSEQASTLEELLRAVERIDKSINAHLYLEAKPKAHLFSAPKKAKRNLTS